VSRRIQDRLHWAEQRILAAVVDAQSRDWTADRPDRIGFGRLAQARFHVSQAARYYPPPAVLVDPVRDLLGAAGWTGTLVLVLLLADDPAAPLTLAVAVVAAAFAAQAVGSALRWWRNRRARRRPAPRAPIDDRQFYSQTGAVIEDCTDEIRRVRQAARGPAADELDAARSWLARERDATR
jgi:hypothetical protein